MECNNCEMLQTGYPIKVIDIPAVNFLDNSIYHFEKGYKCLFSGVESLKVEDLQKGKCRGKED